MIYLHDPTTLPPENEDPTTHWIGAGLNAVDREKTLAPTESNLGRPARNPSLQRLSYFRSIEVLNANMWNECGG